MLHVFERKTSGQGVVKVGKGFTLFISNEDMDITEIVESLEELCLLIDDATKTVTLEIKNKMLAFLDL